jgi:hypothetical protein
MSERQKHVYAGFIDRWAKRYRELWEKNGEHAANAWLRSFVNEEDRQTVHRRAQELGKK